MSPNPKPALISWRSPLREDAVGLVADPAGSLWIWSPATYTDVEPVIAIDATDTRGFSKRTADNAGLNEGREDLYRLEKGRGEGQCAGTYPYGYV